MRLHYPEQPDAVGCRVILIAAGTDTAFSGWVVAASEHGHVLGKPLPGTPEWIRSAWKNRIRRCRSSTRAPADTHPAMPVRRKARIGRNPSAADPWMRHETLASGDGPKTRWPAGAIRHQFVAGLARRSQVADSGTCVVLGHPLRRRIRRRQPSRDGCRRCPPGWLRHRPSGRLRGNPAEDTRRIAASLLLRGARQAKAAFLTSFVSGDRPKPCGHSPAWSWPAGIPSAASGCPFRRSPVCRIPIHSGERRLRRTAMGLEDARSP